jgi:hypothetical protein
MCVHIKAIHILYNIFNPYSFAKINTILVYSGVRSCYKPSYRRAALELARWPTLALNQTCRNSHVETACGRTSGFMHLTHGRSINPFNCGYSSTVSPYSYCRCKQTNNYLQVASLICKLLGWNAMPLSVSKTSDPQFHSSAGLRWLQGFVASLQAKSYVPPSFANWTQQNRSFNHLSLHSALFSEVTSETSICTRLAYLSYRKAPGFREKNPWSYPGFWWCSIQVEQCPKPLCKRWF